MFEVMTDTGKISPTQEDQVEVEAEDEYALLYSWLEALLVKFETQNMLYSDFTFQVLASEGSKSKPPYGVKSLIEKHIQKSGQSCHITRK
jgi:SHS2 domain-containing protein